MIFSSPRRLVPYLALLALLSTSTAPLEAQNVPGIDDYLPTGVTYDAAVSTPEDILGWQVGSWHVRHDQLLNYMRHLAEASPRARLDVIGHTHEQRQLVQLVISSPSNLQRLDEILQAQRDLADPDKPAADLGDLPIVVNLGYSIHGNEASGSNASLLVAYHLAAATGGEVDRWLDEAVIVLDPSLNPDGLSRFAQWANMHRGRAPVADPNHREHREAWPNGRTNHYWFDLNRDWLLAQHPESQARLRRFHEFQPTVLTDFHEMGTNSTYFFQPGVPSRKNPLTPERNVRLTEDIAAYHASALDEIGSLYYSQESFDDFYFGKGSTYPDIHGAVGILFEQASARGHMQESRNGLLTFPFAIRNQVRTSLSTLRAAVDKRTELLEYRRDFYRRSMDLATNDSNRGWVFGDAGDPVRGHRMVELLRRHQIRVHHLKQDTQIGTQSFEAGNAWVIDHRQPQYRLLQALFEQRVDFPDSTFYDVSTWTLPLAFAMPHAPLGATNLKPLLGDEVTTASFPSVAPTALPGSAEEALPYAFVFSWQGFFAPRALGRLLALNLKPRVAMRPFTVETPQGTQSFEPGAIVLPTGRLKAEPQKLRQVLEQIALDDGISVHNATTGLAVEGIDLGSPSLRPVEMPRIALLVGEPVDTYAAGELWHLLDHRFELPLTLLDFGDLPETTLRRYTHLILVDGDYEKLAAPHAEALRQWVHQGGNLIASRRGAVWAQDHIPGVPDPAEADDPAKAEDPGAMGVSTTGSAADSAILPENLRRPFGEAEKDRAEQLISGTIFAMDLDLTHPLAYGYSAATVPVFRNHRHFLKPSSDPYATVGAYLASPLMSGFVSEDNLTRLRHSPGLIAETVGKGTLVRFIDAPNFRAYWQGTNKLLLNAIYFAPLLQNGR